MPALRPWILLAACILAGLNARAGDKGAASSLLALGKIEAPALVPLPPNPEPAASSKPPAPASASPTTLEPDPAAEKSAPKTSAPSDPNAVTDQTYGASSFKDTLGAPTKAAKDKPDDAVECFAHADYLRAHHDPVQAIDYLKQVATNGTVLPQDRARAIIELADTLESRGDEAEALCWLKLWCEMFPGRREFAGVAYRVATSYRRMGMPDLARDAYYLALAHAVNQGDILGADDLANYNKLTTATLWGMAANEYQSGQWSRAAELFERYRSQATAASPFSIEKSEFLQADCYYQLKQTDAAIKLYTDTLARHPFNPLAPQARLRLYHLDIVKGKPGQAQAELQALIWTVRTLWPKDERYWQKQTAQLLLAINQKDAEVLPPLAHETARLAPEGKTWQETINHYDALVSYQVVKTGGVAGKFAESLPKVGDKNTLEEENALAQMSSQLNEVLPPMQANAHP